MVEKYIEVVKKGRIPSCGGREDPRKKSVPALVPPSETEDDGELRCFVSETYMLK